MRLKKLGKSILNIELNTSIFGIWLLVNNIEYFLPYKDYPWFHDAKIFDIYQVELLHNTHLYWPTLDIDLDLESLDNLEQYPLIYRKK